MDDLIILTSTYQKNSAKEYFTFYFQYSESLDRRRQLDSLTVIGQKKYHSIGSNVLVYIDRQIAR